MLMRSRGCEKQKPALVGGRVAAKKSDSEESGEIFTQHNGLSEYNCDKVCYT
jgi:hypothetical protein